MRLILDLDILISYSPDNHIGFSIVDLLYVNVLDTMCILITPYFEPPPLPLNYNEVLLLDELSAYRFQRQQPIGSRDNSLFVVELSDVSNICKLLSTHSSRPCNGIIQLWVSSQRLN